MTAEEKDICTYLKSWPGQFVSGAEIARRACGKWRFREDPNWAMPILTRMVEQRFLESDSTGHFRLLALARREKQKKWLSPQIRKILERAGKIEDVLEIDENLDPTPEDGAAVDSPR